MKKIIFFLLLYLPVIGLSQKVYWFDIFISQESDTVFTAEVLSRKPQSGSEYKFQKHRRKGFDNDTHISVGPFDDLATAKSEMASYQNKTWYASEANSLVDDTVYYYVLVVPKRQRTCSPYGMIRQPAAIVGTTYQGFYDALIVFLFNSGERLAIPIGPFRNKLDAEEAKRTYRLH